ncbi:MAG TPA: hypothetical protein VFK15_15295 [Burkholderiales bacterium]|jgi:hypothetical protein|nr:hypothetical protein [Burkholderiales bacterium]
MADDTDGALQPLVQQLRAKYAPVRVIEAKITRWDDGFLQQIVRYRATLAELKRAGLVTEDMLARRRPQSACGETAIGDSFHLSECGVDERGEPSWDLDLCTESVPRHQELKLYQARQLLERILEGCKGSPGV